jgi:uncharacterized phage protein gp47/JayE
MAKTLDQITTELIGFVVANVAPRLIDTRIGTIIRDVFISPTSSEFFTAFSNIDQVAVNQSIISPGSISNDTMDGLADNFGVSRFSGSPSIGLVRFYKATTPTSTINIPTGTRVATTPTNDTGAYTFTTLSSVQLSPASPPDPITGSAAYAEVAVQAATNGTIGNVDAGTINVLLDPIAGVDGVINASAFTGGKESQTNEEMAVLIKAKAQGRIGTKSGYKDVVLSNFSVIDVQVIGHSDPDVIRDQFGGEVDVVTLSANSQDAVETYAYVNSVTTTQLVPTFRPLLSVSSITGVDAGAAPITLIGPALGYGLGGAGSDYDVILDTAGPYAGSYVENSMIVLHPTTNVPGDGTTLTVTYQNNDLIRVMQAFFNLEDNMVIGSDLLVKAGVKIPIDITASIRIIPGYTSTTVQTDVQSSVSSHFTAQLLGNDVQESDVITVIGNVPGVDYVDVPTFLMALATDPLVGIQQANAGKNQYLRASSVTVNII